MKKIGFLIVAILAMLQSCNNTPNSPQKPEEHQGQTTMSNLPFTEVGTHQGGKMPVDWKFSYRKLSPTEIELKFDATIQPKWNIYSAFLESVDGPVPTTFNFETAGVSTDGKLVEQSEHRFEGHDKTFDMNIVKYKESVSFTQRLKMPEKCNNIKGYLEYMACDDEKCLPPTEVEFEIRF